MAIDPTNLDPYLDHPPTGTPEAPAEAVSETERDFKAAVQGEFVQAAGHETATNNPHSVSAAQVGAPTTAEFNAHTGDASIHYADAPADGTPYSRQDNGWVPGAGGGVTDHGSLTGLGDDDHLQYHTDARGDVRYAPNILGLNGELMSYLAGGYAKIAPGAENEVLTISSGFPQWQPAAGGGNVTGPGSAVDSNIAAFDGTSGTLLKDGLLALAELVTTNQENTSGQRVGNIVIMSQAEYDLLTPNPTTIYFING